MLKLILTRCKKEKNKEREINKNRTAVLSAVKYLPGGHGSQSSKEPSSNTDKCTKETLYKTFRVFAPFTYFLF
jgi:hypothetical protein